MKERLEAVAAVREVNHTRDIERDLKTKWEVEECVGVLINVRYCS